MSEVRGQPLTGVGICYHPFLHRSILSRPDDFAFVEMPLESYLDEAQRGLLDPDLARVGAIAEIRPCIWRSSALSLGSAERPDTGATETAIRRLVARTDAILLREDLAFRRVDGRDLGLPQSPPLTGAMADLVGERCEALAARLPCRFAAGLSLDALVEARGAVAAAFLQRLASSTVQNLVLDLGAAAVAAGPVALTAMLGGIPSGRVVQIVMTVTGTAAWPALDAVLAATGARSIVVRRTRDLFPLGEIFAAVALAREALARFASAPERTALPESVDERPPIVADVGIMIQEQSAFAARCRAANDGEPVADAVAAVRARAVWRERIADLHRKQQLARWAERPASWRV